MSWWLPDDWSAYEHTLFDAFEGFSHDLVAHPAVLSPSEMEQYTQLYKRFTDWHNSLGLLSWANSNNKQVAELYARNLKYWQTIYSANSPTPVTGPGTTILLPMTVPNLTDNIKYIAVTACIAVATASVAKVLRG